MLRNNTADTSCAEAIQTPEQLDECICEIFLFKSQLLKTSNAALQSSLQQALVCPILIRDRVFPGREIRVLYACTHTHTHHTLQTRTGFILSFLEGPSNSEQNDIRLS